MVKVNKIKPSNRITGQMLNGKNYFKKGKIDRNDTKQKKGEKGKYSQSNCKKINKIVNRVIVGIIYKIMESLGQDFTVR